MTNAMPKQQRGAALFIALIMLLVITILAISGARETTLESRMTGNFIQQQKLLNYAEAGLREGEKKLTSPHKPLEPNSCDTTYCFRDVAPNYVQAFDDGALSYTLVSGDSQHTTEWYAIPAPSGASEGEAENPEYGNMMLGIGTFRYEVNAKSTNSLTGNEASMRTTTAKVFN